MEEQAVDEQQFKDILVRWHRVGRGAHYAASDNANLKRHPD